MSTGKIFSAAAAARLEEKRQASAAGRGKDRPRKGSFMRLLFGIFPLLVIPVAIYNLLAFGFGGDVETVDAAGQLVRAKGAPLLELLNGPFLSLPMISDVNWVMDKGDAILLLAIGLLFAEILKSTSTGTATIMNHAISMILFIICLVEFLLWPNFATSTFFILMTMTLLDVLAGVVVTIVSARRDFAVGEGFG